jgi:hypothetical protein
VAAQLFHAVHSCLRDLSAKGQLRTLGRSRGAGVSATAELPAEQTYYFKQFDWPRTKSSHTPIVAISTSMPPNTTVPSKVIRRLSD